MTQQTAVCLEPPPFAPTKGLAQRLQCKELSILNRIYTRVSARARDGLHLLEHNRVRPLTLVWRNILKIHAGLRPILITFASPSIPMGVAPQARIDANAVGLDGRAPSMEHRAKYALIRVRQTLAWSRRTRTTSASTVLPALAHSPGTTIPTSMQKTLLHQPPELALGSVEFTRAFAMETHGSPRKTLRPVCRALIHAHQTLAEARPMLQTCAQRSLTNTAGVLRMSVCATLPVMFLGSTPLLASCKVPK